MKERAGHNRSRCAAGGGGQHVHESDSLVCLCVCHLWDTGDLVPAQAAAYILVPLACLAVWY